MHTTTSDAISEPAIDPETIAALRESLGDDCGPFLVELFDAYFTSADEVVADIERSLAAADARGLARAAHKLKGSSANLGAREVTKVCGRLEQEAKAGRLDYGPTALATVRVELARVRAEFQRDFAV